MTVFVVIVNGEVDKVFAEREDAEKYCAVRQKTWSRAVIFERELIGQHAFF